MKTKDEIKEIISKYLKVDNKKDIKFFDGPFIRDDGVIFRTFIIDGDMLNGIRYILMSDKSDLPISISQRNKFLGKEKIEINPDTIEHDSPECKKRIALEKQEILDAKEKRKSLKKLTDNIRKGKI